MFISCTGVNIYDKKIIDRYPVCINLDLVTYIEPNQYFNGVTRFHFDKYNINIDKPYSEVIDNIKHM